MNKKKLMAVILASSVMAGLAGCSSEPKGTEVPSSTTSETAVTTESTTEETASETTEETTTEAEDNSIDFLEGYETFEVTSNDLVDGVWADVISNTDVGEDLSPDLSWEPVEGAEVYVVYMVDTNAWNWIHWKAGDITDTELPEGFASSMEYVGPYPPTDSTHTYDVYVIALRAPVERVKGSLDAQNPNFDQFITGLDEDAEGNTGNIIAYGRISGTFTNT